MSRRDAFSNKLLKALVVAGVIGIAAVNPFFSVLASYVAKEQLQKRERRRLEDNFYYLKRKGLIERTKSSDGFYLVQPTSKGKLWIKQLELRDVYIKIPKKWDKKWRMLVFDIPVKKQKERLSLLSNLRRLGFIKFQKSMWAYPFECRREIEKIVKAFEISEHVQFIVCEEISDEENLRFEFESRNNINLK